MLPVTPSTRRLPDNDGVDGISVHRAVIEARQRLIRPDGLGENPAGYAGQVYQFRLRDGPRLRQADGERLLYRDEIPLCRADAGVGLYWQQRWHLASAISLRRLAPV